MSAEFRCEVSWCVRWEARADGIDFIVVHPHILRAVIFVRLGWSSLLSGRLGWWARYYAARWWRELRRRLDNVSNSA
jgi:hypothetical protein